MSDRTSIYAPDPLASRTVDWWSVCKFVERYLKRVGQWPMLGTLAWQELPADDPAKLAALLDGARHHALRIDTAQEVMAEASQSISVAEDWAAVAARASGRNSSSYIPRKKTS